MGPMNGEVYSQLPSPETGFRAFRETRAAQKRKGAILIYAHVVQKSRRKGAEEGRVRPRRESDASQRRYHPIHFNETQVDFTPFGYIDGQRPV
jgi:hypothetical protein